MKKIGKLLSLVLALAMVLALASCGGGGGSAAPAGSGSAAPAASSEAGGGQSGASGASGAQDGCNVDVSGVDLSGKNLGYVTITSTAPWGGRVGTEFKRMAEAAGANVKTLDANTVADDVTNYCRQMIDAGVDALAVFAGANLLLGALNLLPVRPMDGGRILWLLTALFTEPYTADRVAYAVGAVASAALLVLCLYLTLTTGAGLFLLPGVLWLAIKGVLPNGAKPDKINCYKK